MTQNKTRTYRIDGDILEVRFEFDEICKKWIGIYPYFADEPRKTPGGRYWRNVTHTGCPHADSQFQDCGTCSHLVKQNHDDLIGVCYNDHLLA